jgi:hypothetical protein
MNNTASIDSNGQYSLAKILGIWLAGGAPLWIFGWLVHPALSQGLLAVDRGLLWMKLMIIGLVWQFVFSMLILYREEGNIRISTISRRFWLNNPVSPRTGQKDNRLWWLLIPLILLVVALELGASFHQAQDWPEIGLHFFGDVALARCKIVQKRSLQGQNRLKVYSYVNFGLALLKNV